MKTLIITQKNVYLYSVDDRVLVVYPDGSYFVGVIHGIPSYDLDTYAVEDLRNGNICPVYEKDISHAYINSRSSTV